jgi:small subunit ribosomal protein S27Ae
MPLAKEKARLSSVYEYDQEKGTIKLKNKKCPRCDNIMARHEKPIPRWACGSCGFTDYDRRKG